MTSIVECKRQLYDINTYLKLSMEEMEILIAKIQMELREVTNKYKKLQQQGGKLHCKQTKKFHNPAPLYYLENFEKSNCRKTNCSGLQLDFNTCFNLCGSLPKINLLQI